MKAGYRLAAGAGALVLTAAMALPTLGFGQDERAPRAYVLAQRDEKLDRVVSHHFDHANVNEVLAWLVQEGFSYVVNDRDFGADTTVTLDVNHATVREAARALADALGGHWVREGKVYVFRRGRGESLGEGLPGDGFAFAGAPEASFNAEEMQKQAERMAREAPHFDAEKLEKQMGELERNMPHFDSEKLQEQIQEMQRHMPDTEKLNEHIREQMEDADRNRVDAEDLERHVRQEMGKHKGGRDGWRGHMTPEQEKAFKKSMEDWGHNFSKQFEGQAPRVWIAPNNEAWREYGRRMEEWAQRVQEEARKHRGGQDRMELPPMPKMPELPPMNFSMPKMAMPPMPPMPPMRGGDDGPDVDVEAVPEPPSDSGIPRERKHYIIKRRLDGDQPPVEMEGVPDPPDVSDSGAPRAHRKIFIRKGGGEGIPQAPVAIDAKRLIGSLTDEERRIMRDNGYLRYSDLTSEQREMIGHHPDGDWRIKLDVDGDSVEIRGK